MINKQGLLNLVARAERGALLPGEATILRDAVELLDDMAMTLDTLGAGWQARQRDYGASTTQSFRVVSGDDNAPGRP